MSKSGTAMASIIARAAASGALICALVGSAAAQGLPEGGLYSIGDPSNVEQYQLELINRARMYPQLEGRILRKTDDLSARLEYAYFRVRLDDMEDELSEHLPMPPLAFNAELADMAFLHAIDMRDGNFQGHVGSDGSTIRDRADRSGYEDWTAVGENVFSYASTASHAHASFEVDWGEGPGGMQPGRPHRVNIHSGEFKEVGIAQVTGDGPDVGPQIVAQEFGNRDDAPAFITGVAYFDLNKNRFYDIGEGIGGVIVTVEGAHHFAVTSASGGYAVPVTEDGEYEVLFKGYGWEERKTVTVANDENVKVDFRPPLPKISVQGSRIGVAGVASPYKIPTVPGAVEHEVLISRTTDSPAPETAETESSDWEIAQDEGYAVRQSDVVAGGAHAFRLAHPTAGSKPQSITFKRTFVPGINGAILFRSRLGYADAGQVARVQVSADESQNWRDVWTRIGSGGAGDKAFGTQSASLGDFAGQLISIRFEYFIGAGYVFDGAGEGYGWYFDDIAFVDTEEILQMSVEKFDGGEDFDLVAPSEGSVKLYARARTAGAVLPVSSPVEVVSTPNDFSGWMKRNHWKASERRPLKKLRESDDDGDGLTLFEEYALEWNGADASVKDAKVLPESRDVGDEIVLDYASDRGRTDVALVPEVSLDGGESWVVASDPSAPEEVRDRLLEWPTGSVEKRRVSVGKRAGYLVMLRLAIRDLLEEDEEEEGEEDGEESSAGVAG